MMNDMNAATSFAAESDHQLNGFVFRFARSRAQEALVRTTIRISALRLIAARVIYWPRQLCVHDQSRAQTREFRHRFTEIAFSNIREFVNARMNQKTFEADDA